MRKFLLTAAVMALALGTACATTGATGSETSDATITETDLSASNATASAASDSKKDDTEMVCVEQEVVGSHIPKKICRPKYKVKQDKDDAANAFQTHQPVSPYQR